MSPFKCITVSLTRPRPVSLAFPSAIPPFPFPISFLFFLFLSCFFFQGCACGIWRFLGWRSNQSCCCPTMPEPQQRQIWAASSTYTTAHSNAGSLTHWARLGIELTTSWFLDGFVSAVPRQEFSPFPISATPIHLLFQKLSFLTHIPYLISC